MWPHREIPLAFWQAQRLAERTMKQRFRVGNNPCGLRVGGRRFCACFFNLPTHAAQKFPLHLLTMAKAISTLDWCIVRLGDDHNWWVAETSDPVRWDVDGLSIIDPRQLSHLIELVDP